MKKIGLIINPMAGVGGKVGLKGSDGSEIQQLALKKGAKAESAKKVEVALNELLPLKNDIHFFAAPGKMGGDLLKQMGFNFTVVGSISEQTTYEDTESISKLLSEENVDLIMFAGGDGTARNIYNAISTSIPCLGIPAGVKIHSAVYANNPKSAGLVAFRFIKSPSNIQLLSCEVMDIDEKLFRKNQVVSMIYGYLTVPFVRNLIQSPKSGGKHTENDIYGISEQIAECMLKEDSDTYFVFGTGGTTFKILEHIGLNGSLLGVDVVKGNEIIKRDATEEMLLEVLRSKKCKLIVTIIGGQGHIFGRGNQQLSPKVIYEIGINNIWVVSCADKIHNLPNGVLHVDTSDSCLDEALSGYIKVITGLREKLVCKITS